MPTLRDAICEAIDCIAAIKLFQPSVAIVLGSGLSDLASQLEHAAGIPYRDIPYFPRTSAMGHPGELLLGYLGGMPVALLCGRAHRYEGWTNADVQFPTQCLHAMGAKTLIATNAAGGLNPRYRSGDLMLIDSHIDLLWTRTSQSYSSQRTFRNDSQATEVASESHRRGISPYSPPLLRSCHSIARGMDIPLHQGCYLATLGPTYETRSEYRMFRWMGADAVGMSTVPEVTVAAASKMDVLAISVITNVASTDTPQATSHQDVVDTGKAASANLRQLITQLLDKLAGEPD